MYSTHHITVTSSFIKYQLQLKCPTDLTYSCCLWTYFTHSSSWNILKPNDDKTTSLTVNFSKYVVEIQSKYDQNTINYCQVQITGISNGCACYLPLAAPSITQPLPICPSTKLLPDPLQNTCGSCDSIFLLPSLLPSPPFPTAVSNASYTCIALLVSWWCFLLNDVDEQWPSISLHIFISTLVLCYCFITYSLCSFFSLFSQLLLELNITIRF